MDALIINGYSGDEYIGSMPATEWAQKLGMSDVTVRLHARNKDICCGKYRFEYTGDYYQKHAEPEEAEEKPVFRTLSEMAREAKRRGISYGLLEAEEYTRKMKRRLQAVPAGRRRA